MTPYYDHSGITIYHGDCREILPQLESVDLVLTDPPYGILGGMKRIGGSKPIGGSKTIGGSNMVRVKEYDLSWDIKPIEKNMIDTLIKMSENQVFWGWNHYSDFLPSTKSVIVWDKKCQNGWKDTFSDAEIAWASQGKCTVYRHLWVGALRKGNRHDHPTEKPVELMQFCLSLFNDVETVLDPYMGVGTTLVAAKNLGKKAIGIEIEERYCEIAVKRLAQEVLFK